MDANTSKKTEIPIDTEQETIDENKTDGEIPSVDEKQAENPETAPKAKNTLINQYKKSLNTPNDVDHESDASSIDGMRLAESNWGMQFSGSYISAATFIINGTAQQVNVTEDTTSNLLGEKDEAKFLKWCIEHYQSFYFSMLLAVCILDRQPYQTIYHMAKELQEILSDSASENDDKKTEWFSKSQIVKALGIIQYSDKTSVRGLDQETDFLCLPVHSQAEHYIQLMVNEFPELKYILTNYLTDKISKIYGSKQNYIVISGCMEALAYIGIADLLFFNDQIIPRFLRKKNIGMDYCVSVLLGKLYQKKNCQDYVKKSVVEWGQLKNNSHNLLVSLYVCSLLGKQEALVCDIWINVLNQLLDELLTGNSLGKISHIDMLQGLFKSGNRNISYYKGVIHAFHTHVLQANQSWNRGRKYLLNTIFFLFLLEDHDSCYVSGSGSHKREMMWIGIFPKLNESTGKELTNLWYMILDSTEYSRDCWKLLDEYLKSYHNYQDTDVEVLTFFFYHINRKLGRNQGISFLKECAERDKNPKPIAGQIYERIKRVKL